MAEIDSPSSSMSVPEGDNQLVSHNDDATVTEHEDEGGREAVPAVSNGDLRIEDLDRTSTDQETADNKEPTAIKKTTMSVPPNGKTSSAAATVKKIINSGTFGVGSLKPAGAKASAPTPTVTKATAPALKKLTTSAPSASSKPVLSASMSSKPAVTSAAASRRTSIVPTKAGAPLLSKPSLSSSANNKPSTENTPIRSSLASPTGSVGSVKAPAAVRPRASLSEAARKAPLASRPSAASSTKPSVPPSRTTPVSRSSAAPPAKSSRVTGSISSIKEVKEGATAEANGGDRELAELQGQLKDATESLQSKSTVVSDLETQIAKLEESLVTASAEAESRGSSTSELEKAKNDAESQLSEARIALAKVKVELAEVNSSLNSVQKELKEAKAAAVSQNEVAQTLQSQIQVLEATVLTSKKEIEQAEKTNFTAAAEASSIEREALLKAQTDFHAISDEINALKAAHSTASKDAETRIAELEEKASASEVLQSHIASLKAEKEENANKLSELEVEILELKESQESLEDTRDGLHKRIAALEDELANASVSAGLAIESASKKDAEHANQLKEILAKHATDMEAEALRYGETVASLDKLKKQYSDALAAHKQTQEDILNKEQRHASALEELERASADQHAALTAEMEKVSQELHDQESIYNSKVDTVKAEHTRLLEEAFERARNEAAKAHSQELQSLRSGSSTTMEQIQEANRVALEDLKKEHASNLESEVSSLSKQINKLALELKATQEDLAKAKAALEASRAEVESLTKQRDEARAQAAATPALTPAHTEEVARLTKELSNTKDDLAAVTDMLNLTKSSMAELSDKQANELEAVAKGRADEVVKLRFEHDQVIGELATQKSELLIRLSDLEGELATARASIGAQGTSSPKTNGHGVSHSSSAGVTKEELTKMHEAHNLKIHDLHAEHEKAMKHLREELENARSSIGELQQDLGRKTMEIQYLEQDQDESQEQITRLKEDINTLTEKLGDHAT